MISRMLKDAKERAKQDLEPDEDLDRRVEAETIPKLVQEQGLTSLVEKMRQWQKELDAGETELDKRGFDWHDGRVSLTWQSPKPLRQALEQAKRSAHKERDAELQRFEHAILDVWAAPDAAEAKRIAERLL